MVFDQLIRRVLLKQVTFKLRSKGWVGGSYVCCACVWEDGNRFLAKRSICQTSEAAKAGTLEELK